MVSIYVSIGANLIKQSITGPYQNRKSSVALTLAKAGQSQSPSHCKFARIQNDVNKYHCYNLFVLWSLDVIMAESDHATIFVPTLTTGMGPILTHPVLNIAISINLRYRTILAWVNFCPFHFQTDSAGTSGLAPAVGGESEAPQWGGGDGGHAGRCLGGRGRGGTHRCQDAKQAEEGGQGDQEHLRAGGRVLHRDYHSLNDRIAVL